VHRWQGVGLVVWVMGDGGKRSQVITTCTKMFRLPRVKEGLGMKFRVAEVRAEASVIEGVVH